MRKSVQEYRRTARAKPGYQERRNKENKDRRDRYKKLINEVKVTAGCINCGYNKHPSALHFDHVRGIKLNNVAWSLRDHGWQRILVEISKCEIRCANCHAIKSWENPS